MKEVFFVPDNLRITTPVSTNGSIISSNPASEPPRTAPVGPEQPGRTPGEGNGPGGLPSDPALIRDSVYGRFIRQIEGTPDLLQTLARILSDTVTKQDLLAARQAPDSPLRALTANIAADRDGILEDLSFQQKNVSQFSGPLFRLLEQISAQSGDSQFDLRLADFLKAYNGYFTAASTTLAIRSGLETIKREIPLPYARKLQPAIDKLLPGDTPQGTQANLSTIKKVIIPLLSEYVTKTNDYGKSRSDISMLLHNTSILNVSTKENLSAKFDQLFRYCKYNLNLPDVTIEMVRSFFADEILNGREKKENGFFDSLVSLLSGGAGKGAAHSADKASLRDVCNSMLLDNSVYMPFNHFFLPAFVNGRFFFAQIWVEKKPGDEEENRRGKSGPAGPAAVYLSFDIQDLGYFEACVHVFGRQVELDLACPSGLAKYRSVIRSEMTKILQNNGLTPGVIHLSTCSGPQIPAKILKKINERKHAVDVSV